MVQLSSEAQCGPNERRLLQHPPVVGLCFGSCGEASEGVYDLLREVSDQLFR